MNEPKTIYSALKAARELISDPKRWVQGCNARTQEGAYVYSSDPEAYCFCSYGALLKVAPSWLAEDALDALSEFSLAEYGKATIRLNDDPKTTHAMVLELFDQAIEVARVIRA